MNKEQPLRLDDRTQRAVDELQGVITQKYPTATFELARAADDPESIHLTTIVDVDDPDEVSELVIDREVELQVEEGIPLHVIPIRTPERVVAEMQAQASQTRHPRRRVPLWHRGPIGRPTGR